MAAQLCILFLYEECNAHCTCMENWKSQLESCGKVGAIYVSELSAAGLQFALGASHGRGPPVVIEWFKAGPCALTSSTQVSTMFINFNRTSRAWWHLSQTRPPLRIKLPGPVRLQGQSSSLRVAGGRVFTPETKGGLFHHDPCLQLIHSEKRLPYRFAGYNIVCTFFFSLAPREAVWRTRNHRRRGSGKICRD